MNMPINGNTNHRPLVKPTNSISSNNVLPRDDDNDNDNDNDDNKIIIIMIIMIMITIIRS